MNNRQAVAVTRVSREDFEAMVLRHLPQVRIVARRIASRLPHQVEMGDLISAGVLGLIDAITRYDSTRDASLATFAQFRIRGAILDSLRAADWGSRGLRRMARRIDSAHQELTASLKRRPSEPELAAHLGLPLAIYQEQVTRINGLQLAQFVTPEGGEEPGDALDQVPSSEPSPLERVLLTEQKEWLMAAIEELPRQERRVIALYYMEELTMRAIGGILQVSESRVCQLHTRALARLKGTVRRCAAAYGRCSWGLPCPRSRARSSRSGAGGSQPGAPIHPERHTHPAAAGPA